MQKQRRYQREQQNVYRNSEGYLSPTEGAALSRIIREERAAARKERQSNTQYTLAWQNPYPYPVTNSHSQERHKNGRNDDENPADQTNQGRLQPL